MNKKILKSIPNHFETVILTQFSWHYFVTFEYNPHLQIGAL